MTKINTEAAKIALTAAFDGFSATPCYYDKAPAKAALPYSVIKRVHISPLEDGDLLSFTLEMHTDDTMPGSAAALERLCDEYRNNADGALLSDGKNFFGHINFDSQQDGDLDAEYDLAHRTQSYSLRLFYI